MVAGEEKVAEIFINVNKNFIYMTDFSQRFEIVYQKFAVEALTAGRQSSKLAFSRFMNVKQGKMQAWERGQIPRPDDLIAMHDKLGFSLRWLLTGEGEQFDENSPAIAEGAMAKKIAELETKLAKEQELNHRLMKRLLGEDGSDTQATGDVGKASGQE